MDVFVVYNRIKCDMTMNLALKMLGYALPCDTLGAYFSIG